MPGTAASVDCAALGPRVAATPARHHLVRADASADTWRATPPHPPSPTAACIAGEARTLTLEPVRAQLVHSMLRPLRADALLVLAASHTPTWYVHPRGERTIAPATPPSTLLHAAREVGATSLIIANDSSPLVAEAALERGAGHIQRPLVARWAVCLREVVAAEGARSRRYDYVVRARPDLRYGCKLCVPRMPHAEWALFIRDYLALMPRRVADHALGRPSAGLATCNERTPRWSRRREEWCNPCLLWRRGVAVLVTNPWKDIEIARPCLRSLVGKLGPTCTCIGDENCTAAPPMPRGTCAVEPWDREGDAKLNALAGAAREPDKRCACIAASRATPGTDDAANCAAFE